MLSQVVLKLTITLCEQNKAKQKQTENVLFSYLSEIITSDVIELIL